MGASDAVAAEHREPVRRVHDLIDAAPACLTAAGARTWPRYGLEGGYFAATFGLGVHCFLDHRPLGGTHRRTDARPTRPCLRRVVLAHPTAGPCSRSARSVAPSLHGARDPTRARLPRSGIVAVLLLAHRRNVDWLVGDDARNDHGGRCLRAHDAAVPDRFEYFDPVAEYHSPSQSAIGTASASSASSESCLGWRWWPWAVRSSAVLWRPASTAIASVTLYFTYSRGAWLALGVGVAFALLVHATSLAPGGRRHNRRRLPSAPSPYELLRVRER